MENINQNIDLNPKTEKARNLRIRDFIKLSVRAFRVRPMRTFLTILGMSVGIGTVFFLISLGYGLQYILLGKLAPTEDSLVSLQAFYPEEGLAISKDEINQIYKIAGVVEISPIYQNSGEVNYSGFSGDLIVKIIDEKYNRLSGFVPNYYNKNTNDLNKGIVISNTALRLLGLKEDESSLGKAIEVKTVYYKDGKENISSTKSPVPITGIVDDGSQSPYIFIPNYLMNNAPDYFGSVFIKAKDDAYLETLRSELISKGFIISARVDTVRQAKKITDVITMVLGIFGVAALIVSSIGMFNTMLISFMERIFEVGIMKSIGATRIDILGLFLMESFIMGILGGVGGIAMGLVGGFLVNAGMNFLAKYLGGNPINLFIYSVKFMIFIILLSGVVGLLSGYWPARRAAKLSAREAFLRK